MKISEVVEKLKEIQEKHGDLFVRVETAKDYNVPFERMNLVVHGYSLYIK